MKHVILIIVGLLLVGLGAIGLLVPVWPTTPFIIVAAACFSCAPALRKWLEGIPLFGEHVTNYRNKTGLTKKTVIFSLTFLWGMMLISCFFVGRFWVVALLLGIGVAVTIHILCVAKARGGESEE